jgi:hypothetical protein
VLTSQRILYDDLAEMNVEQLAEFSNLDKEPGVDLARKIYIDKDGDYAYGMKSKQGVKVKDDQSFGQWMLSKDFPNNTKMHLRRFLASLISGN